MLFNIYCVSLLITGSFSSILSNGEHDVKVIKSESNEELNSLHDSADDRHKRSFETGGFQWGGSNQLDQPSFNNGYQPPNNYYNFGRSGENDSTGGSPNQQPPSNQQYPQPPFNRGNPNQNYGNRSPLEDVMGKALETVIVQSVRSLLDMTPLGGGQGDYMRSPRKARSVVGSDHEIENYKYKNDDYKMEKRGSRNEEDESINQSDFMRLQMQQQNFMKEIRRQNRLRQQAYQQSMMKNKENIENQKRIELMNQQKNSDKYWQRSNDLKREQQTDSSKYQEVPKEQRNTNKYREKQRDSKVIENRDTRTRRNQQRLDYLDMVKKQQLKEDYPTNWQQEQNSYKYNGQRRYATNNNDQSNRDRYFQEDKTSPKSINEQQLHRQKWSQEQDFIKQRGQARITPKQKESDFMDYQPMKDVRQRDDWAQQIRKQNRGIMQQQDMREHDSMMEMNDNVMKQQNMIKKMGPEQRDVMQPQWQQQQYQQQAPISHQQAMMSEWQQNAPQRNIMSQQITQSSDVIPGNDQSPNQASLVNAPYDPSAGTQEVLLQPATVIKRYVTYRNRFKPPPQSVLESAIEQEMSAEDESPQRERTASIMKKYADEGVDPSTERKRMSSSQVEKRMKDSWIEQNK